MEEMHQIDKYEEEECSSSPSGIENRLKHNDDGCDHMWPKTNEVVHLPYTTKPYDFANYKITIPKDNYGIFCKLVCDFLNSGSQQTSEEFFKKVSENLAINLSQQNIECLGIVFLDFMKHVECLKILLNQYYQTRPYYARTPSVQDLVMLYVLTFCLNQCSLKDTMALLTSLPIFKLLPMLIYFKFDHNRIDCCRIASAWFASDYVCQRFSFAVPSANEIFQELHLQFREKFQRRHSIYNKKDLLYTRGQFTHFSAKRPVAPDREISSFQVLPKRRARPVPLTTYKSPNIPIFKTTRKVYPFVFLKTKRLIKKEKGLAVRPCFPQLIKHMARSRQRIMPKRQFQVSHPLRHLKIAKSTKSTKPQGKLRKSTRPFKVMHSKSKTSKDRFSRGKHHGFKKHNAKPFKGRQTTSGKSIKKISRPPTGLKIKQVVKKMKKGQDELRSKNSQKDKGGVRSKRIRKDFKPRQQHKKIKIKIKKPPPPEVKQNTTTILRDAGILAKEREQQHQRIVDLLSASKGYLDYTMFMNEYKKIEEEELVQEIERKHIAGLLSHEEAIIAKQKLLLSNIEKRKEFEIEKAELDKQLEEHRMQEQDKLKTLVAQIQETTQKIKESKSNLLHSKQRTVQSMIEEKKLRLERLLATRQAELERKIQLIREFKALHTMRKYQSKLKDSKFETLCGMSILELKTRLDLCKRNLREELDNKRKTIKNVNLGRKLLANTASKFIQAMRKCKRDIRNETKLKPKRYYDTKKLNQVDFKQDVKDLKQKFEQAKLVRHQQESFLQNRKINFNSI